MGDCQGCSWSALFMASPAKKRGRSAPEAIANLSSAGGNAVTFLSTQLAYKVMRRDAHETASFHISARLREKLLTSRLPLPTEG